MKICSGHSKPLFRYHSQGLQHSLLMGQYPDQIIISSYIVDIPRQRICHPLEMATWKHALLYMSSVEARVCPCKLARRAEFILCLVVPNFCNDAYSATEKISELSLPSKNTGLASFLFLSVHRCVKICEVFCLEPVQFLSVGISKPLKECLVSILKDESRVSTAMNLGRWASRKLGQIQKTVLVAINSFLLDVEHLHRVTARECVTLKGNL